MKPLARRIKEIREIYRCSYEVARRKAIREGYGEVKNERRGRE